MGNRLENLVEGLIGFYVNYGSHMLCIYGFDDGFLPYIIDLELNALDLALDCLIDGECEIICWFY